MWLLYDVSTTATHSFNLHNTDILKKSGKLLTSSASTIEGTLIEKLNQDQLVKYLKRVTHATVVKEIAGYNKVTPTQFSKILLEIVPWTKFNLTSDEVLKLLPELISEYIASPDIRVSGSELSVNLDQLAPAIANIALRHRSGHTLLTSLKVAKPRLDTLQKSCQCFIQESLYRYYHTSFKTYTIQDLTDECVAFFNSVKPSGTKLNPMFLDLVKQGTGKKFELEHNTAWTDHTNPLILAAFHCQAFVNAMSTSLSHDLPPNVLTPDWGMVLYLYNLR